MGRFRFNQKPKTHLRLDPDYVPMILGQAAFLEAVQQSRDPQLVKIALERESRQIATYETHVFHDNQDEAAANLFYIERLIKTLLWQRGGFRLYISGPESITKAIKSAYAKGGLRDFDRQLMSRVYEQPFEVIIKSHDQMPKAYETSQAIGRHLKGCRIGFDAGGSDRKVSAVIDGEAIYSEEVVWHPKTASDPNYHYQGIMDSLQRAKSKLPRVDAIGVSSAGIFINNRVAVASLFRAVPKERFDKEVRDMYLRIQSEFGGVPLVVINDGDVTALAGAMSLDSNNILGIAMGTSEAAGYVDHLGNITGWLNELSFVPVDLNQEAAQDEWSGDRGVGVHYFSQDAVIRLAGHAGIDLFNAPSPAEKLKVVQALAEAGHEDALEIFRTIGVYLGYELAYYAQFYRIDHVLILGRVTSGIGGQKMLQACHDILKTEFKALGFKVTLPDEKSRRVGQSIAAASLPEIKKEGN